MRRGLPELVIGVLLLVLLSSYVLVTRRAVFDLQSEARSSSQMYARIFRATSDTSEDASKLALLDLTTSISAQGIPLVVTDTKGTPIFNANVPADIAADSAKLRVYARELDLENRPVIDSLTGQIHFGNTALVKWLRIIPIVQAASALVLLFAAVYIVRTRGNAERERVWAGMARESAHQLGTPLSSLSGWIEIIEERGTDGPTQAVVDNMRADMLRLDRVAHRFERIGREPRRDDVDVSALVERLGTYFRARVPKLKHAVTIDIRPPDEPVLIKGDAVLLEWALEVLVKNAVDALAGRGGRIELLTAARAEGGARVSVSDDGPGISRELRGRIFEPGFSTKTSGWGIGLSLARRIVSENHGGTLRLIPSDRGASFEIILP
ncbi:MAG: two-component histidine kinase [Gemmatimonadetes bacterium]|nr:two-component histidine kinase [Gemmatimonadota bacterium]